MRRPLEDGPTVTPRDPRLLAIAGRREDGRVDIPETRYAKTVDGAHIAFQTFGHGEVDLLLIQGSFSNLDANWDVPRSPTRCTAWRRSHA